MVSLDRSDVVAAGRSSVLQFLSNSFDRLILFGTSGRADSWYVGFLYPATSIESIVDWHVHLGGDLTGEVLVRVD